MALIGDFFTSVDTVFVSFFSTGASRVAIAARTPFNTLVTLYVLLWGLAMWRGLIQEPLSDGVLRILKIVLIGTFALNAAVYGPRIATTLYRTPDQLASVLVPSASIASTGTALDDVLAKGVNVGKKFTDAMSLTSPLEAIAFLVQAMMIWGFTIVIVTYAAALILLTRIGLSVVLALGPLFICLLLFDSTKQFFTGWLSQALIIVFQYVVAVAFVSLGMSFYDAAVSDTLTAIGSSLPLIVHAFRMFIVGGAVLIALMQSGAIASALAGGVQIGTMGGVGWAAEKMRRLASAPWRTVRGGLAMNQRRHANDFYRKHLGLKPTLTTRMMNSVLHGSNQSEKK